MSESFVPKKSMIVLMGLLKDHFDCNSSELVFFQDRVEKDVKLSKVLLRERKEGSKIHKSVKAVVLKEVTSANRCHSLTPKLKSVDGVLVPVQCDRIQKNGSEFCGMHGLPLASNKSNDGKILYVWEKFGKVGAASSFFVDQKESLESEYEHSQRVEVSKVVRRKNCSKSNSNMNSESESK